MLFIHETPYEPKSGNAASMQMNIHLLTFVNGASINIKRFAVDLEVKKTDKECSLYPKVQQKQLLEVSVYQNGKKESIEQRKTQGRCHKCHKNHHRNDFHSVKSWRIVCDGNHATSPVA